MSKDKTTSKPETTVAVERLFAVCFQDIDGTDYAVTLTVDDASGLREQLDIALSSSNPI